MEPGLPLLFLLLAATAPVRGEATGDEVVLCHDPERRIVQTVLASKCAGRIVSEEEASAIREEERLRRARLLQKPRYALDGGKAGIGARKSRAIAFGSAFPIDEKGLYLTARHVIEPCKDVLLGRPDGVTYSAYVIERSETADIALLRSMPADRYFPFDPEPPAPGTMVRAIGYPEEGRPRILPLETEGKVKAADIDIEGNFVLFDAPVRSGNSGGPLLSASGRLVGMVIAKQNEVKAYATTGQRTDGSALALSNRALKEFLDGVGHAPPAATAADDGGGAEAYRVVCER